MKTREKHCEFSKKNNQGRCIAICSKNRLIDGKMVDCIGLESETIEEHSKRMKKEAKFRCGRTNCKL